MKQLAPYFRQGRGWYGDFRGLGGKREALIPPGGTHATQDQDVALALYAARRQYYRDKLAGKVAAKLSVLALTKVGLPVIQ